MIEEDWVLVREVFYACRSRRGNKGWDDRKFLDALHFRSTTLLGRSTLSSIRSLP
jgi:hypothetical protein